MNSLREPLTATHKALFLTLASIVAYFLWGSDVTFYLTVVSIMSPIWLVFFYAIEHF